MPEPRLAIHLLGPVDVRIEGRPLAVDTRKAVALLAYLAVTGRPASRESVAALLWPEADGVDARGALRRTLSVLNAALGGRGLRIDRASVAVEDRAVEVDIVVFRHWLAVARGHGHEPGLACHDCDAALEAALALDRGPFMDGFTLRDSETFEEWQRAEAEAHRRDLVGALERLASSRIAAGLVDQAIAAGRRWLDLDPLHEPAHRLLMTAYASAGETAAAIRQYRDGVRILDAELGVAPLAATTELYEAIRAGTFVGPAVVAEPREAGSGVAARPAAAHPRAAPVDPGPRAAGRPLDPPFVGRTAELAEVRQAMARVGPDGALIVIEGEPGIGKTRLARAVVDDWTASGGRALEARGYAGEAAIPYASVVDLLRAGLARRDAAEHLGTVRPDLLVEVARLVPIAGVTARHPVAADPLGRARLVEAIGETLAALVTGPRPGIVWLDDAHWADASSLEALAFLAHRLADRSLVLLLSWRREDLPPGPMPELVAATEREGRTTVVRLGRMPPSDVAALARAVRGAATPARFLEALIDDAEGLPLHVVEALAAPDTEPGDAHRGLDALIRARLASISELARQVESAAAVIGRSFGFETLRATAGRSEDETVAALEELVRRGFVREVGPDEGGDVRFDFVHGRLRDVAYEDVGLARRRLLHRRVADALGGPGAERAGAVRWPLIAFHEQLAGRIDRAAEAHRQAGRAARDVFANQEAREHFDAALGLGHPATRELHEELGRVQTLLGDYGSAIAHLEAAAALAAPRDDPSIELQLGRVHARRGDWVRAETHLEAALAAAAPSEAELRSEILADRSAVAHERGNGAAAAGFADAALTAAIAAGSPTATARAEEVLGLLARRAGDLSTARKHLELALAAVAADAAPALRMATLNALALVARDAGDLDRSLDLTAEALVIGERFGDRHRQAALENNLADLYHATGRPEAAMAHLKRAVALFAEVGGASAEPEPEIWKLVEW